MCDQRGAEEYTQNDGRISLVRRKTRRRDSVAHREKSDERMDVAILIKTNIKKTQTAEQSKKRIIDFHSSAMGFSTSESSVKKIFHWTLFAFMPVMFGFTV